MIASFSFIYFVLRGRSITLDTINPLIFLMLSLVFCALLLTLFGSRRLPDRCGLLYCCDEVHLFLACGNNEPYPGR